MKKCKHCGELIEYRVRRWVHLPPPSTTVPRSGEGVYTQYCRSTVAEPVRA